MPPAYELFAHRSNGSDVTADRATREKVLRHLSLISLLCCSIHHYAIVVNMVKSSRSEPQELARKYASPLRAAQAAQTRQRILDAAIGCFSAAGYVGTTLADIAAEAGVSVETVRAQGPKSALLLSSFEKAFALSEGQDSIFDRPEVFERTNLQTDAVDFVRGTCRFLARAAVRSTRLWLIFYHAASMDSAIRASYDAFTSRMHADALRLVTMVADRGPIRTDRARRKLADELEVLFLPFPYERLVDGAGWNLEEYADYLFGNACRILFPQDDQPPKLNRLR